jgi:hypothetical protein
VDQLRDDTCLFSRNLPVISKQGGARCSALICRVNALSVGSEARHVASTRATFHKCKARRRKQLRAWTPFLSYVCTNHTPSLARKAHFIALIPATASLGNLTRSDFLANSKSQLDADHYGLKRRLMEYLAVIRLRALIAQDAEVEKANAQEVTLKKYG